MTVWLIRVFPSSCPLFRVWIHFQMVWAKVHHRGGECLSPSCMSLFRNIAVRSGNSVPVCYLYIRFFFLKQSDYFSLYLKFPYSSCWSLFPCSCSGSRSLSNVVWSEFILQITTNKPRRKLFKKKLLLSLCLIFFLQKSAFTCVPYIYLCAQVRVLYLFCI